MSRQRLAQVVTVAVLAAVAGLVLLRTKGMETAALTPEPAKTEWSPQDVIYEMLDLAREGRVADYLACHGGAMLESLRQAVQEAGEESFASQLKRSGEGVKGVAINEPQVLRTDEVRARVEFVYQDRNEVQWMHLTRDGRRWKITRVEPAERTPAPIPYGTPVK